MGRGCSPRGHAFADTDPVRRDTPLEALQPGEILFRQGDACEHVYTVVSGALALERTDARGHESVLGLAFPGELLGYECLVGAEARWCTAVASERSTVRPAPRLEVVQSLDPDAHEALVESLGRDLNRAHELRFMIAHWSAADRLCWVVHDLARRMHAIGTLRLPLCRADLASWIGIRPETLARAIRELRDRGIAEFSGRQVRFDTAALAAVVDGFALDPALADRNGSS